MIIVVGPTLCLTVGVFPKMPHPPPPPPTTLLTSLLRSQTNRTVFQKHKLLLFYSTNQQQSHDFKQQALTVVRVGQTHKAPSECNQGLSHMSDCNQEEPKDIPCYSCTGFLEHSQWKGSRNEDQQYATRTTSLHSRRPSKPIRLSNNLSVQ
ncbi:hypothetical protein ILYODFUR_023566 [Ilyodon furcidens]|uniref:Uncharacterized protein n=1 Tax=Ilyodon furcidens TaxID=33524 RepID=A0ABV0SZJ7_9TELE